MSYTKPVRKSTKKIDSRTVSTKMLEQPKMLMTSPELCALISICGRSGVSELKFRDLHVRFGPAERVKSHARDAEAQEPFGAAEEITAQSEEMAAQAARDLEMEELMITDPAEYERRFREGDLEPEPGGSEYAV